MTSVRLEPLPPRLKFEIRLGMEELALRFKLAAAVSTSPTVIEIGALGVSSLVLWSAMGPITGKSLMGLTVRTKVVPLLVDPSLAVTVIVLTPNWLVSGVITTARLVPLPVTRILASGTSTGLEEVAVTTTLLKGVSRSLTAKPIGGETVSSAMICPEIGEIVGASFLGKTLRSKVVLTEPKFVSLTDIVTVAVPDSFETGVSITVLLPPLPPKTMLAFGSRSGLEDVPDRVNNVVGVVESPMVKAMGPAEVSSLMLGLEIAEMVGFALPVARTFTTKVRLNVLLMAWPSLTVTVIVAVPVTLFCGRKLRRPF